MEGIVQEYEQQLEGKPYEKPTEDEDMAQARQAIEQLSLDL